MKRNFLLVAAAVMMVFGACQKDKNPAENTENNTAATQTLDEYYQENREKGTQTFIVNANAAIEVHGEQGSTVTIPANNFVDAYGNVITGNVEVKLIECFTKADMIRMNKPTLTSDDEMLISGGEFFLDVTLPGSDESLRPLEPMRIHVPAETEDPNMLFWVDNGNGWELVGSGDRAPDGHMEPWDEGYVASIMSGGWFNFDWAPPGDFCDICIRVPAGSDPGTTDVLVSVDGQMTMVNIDDSHFDGHDLYCFEAPEGAVVSVIVIQMDPLTGMNMYNIVYSVTIECGMIIDATPLLHGSIGQMDLDIQNLP